MAPDSPDISDPDSHVHYLNAALVRPLGKAPVREKASLEEENRLLRMILEAVYLDPVANKSLVGIVPKPAYLLFGFLLAGAEGKGQVYKAKPEAETTVKKEEVQ